MRIKLLSLFVLICLMLTGCSDNKSTDGSHTGGGSIIILTDESFADEVLNYKGTVLIDFYADWCGPCQMMAPIIEEIASERTDIKVCKLDVDTETATASAYNISSIPTLLVFNDGVLTGRSVGLKTKSQILGLL